MRELFKKYGVHFAIVLILLTCSWTYRAVIAHFSGGLSLEEEKRLAQMENKNVVTVWMKESRDSETRKYQIFKFNMENKDNIYIDFHTYGEDYYNLLRTSLAAKEKPDIFQYGYYELLKNDSIATLDEAGIDLGKVDSDNLFLFNRQPYGVKVTGNSVKFAWNKEMFEGAGLDPDSGPKTWGQLIEYAKKLKAAYPDVVPFEFPAFTMGEIKISIGEPSVSLGSIYTTFWDYKKGTYNFEYAKDILNLYNRMYAMGLLDKEFFNKSREEVRQDFYNEKAAMIISTYEDKDFFTNIVEPGFPMGIDSLPKVATQYPENYYYAENYNCIVINKKSLNNIYAVKKVYEWFLDEDVNLELKAADKALPLGLKDSNLKEDEYTKYDDIENFSNETYDPTVFINYKGQETVDLFCDAIKGTKTVEEVIKQLNTNFERYMRDMVSKDSFDFSYYIKSN